MDTIARISDDGRESKCPKCGTHFAGLTVRMRKLAACEGRLLRAMPVLPLFFDSYSYLEKPFVGGMTRNLLGVPQFKTGWIDTNWRPQ